MVEIEKDFKETRFISESQNAHLQFQASRFNSTNTFQRQRFRGVK